MVAASYLKNISYFFFKDVTIILHGWREPAGAKMWRFSLRTKNHLEVPLEWSSIPIALNAHHLLSVGPFGPLFTRNHGLPRVINLALIN